MIIVVKPDHQEEDIREIVGRLEEFGLRGHLSRGERRALIGVMMAECRRVAEAVERSL